MNKYITFFILVAFSSFNPQVYADGLDQFQQETNTIWSPADQGTTDASQDGHIGTSMLAWGVGLAVVIAIVFGLIKSLTPTSTTTTT